MRIILEDGDTTREVRYEANERAIYTVTTQRGAVSVAINGSSAEKFKATVLGVISEIESDLD